MSGNNKSKLVEQSMRRRTEDDEDLEVQAQKQKEEKKNNPAIQEETTTKKRGRPSNPYGLKEKDIQFVLRIPESTRDKLYQVANKIGFETKSYISINSVISMAITEYIKKYGL